MTSQQVLVNDVDYSNYVSEIVVSSSVTLYTRNFKLQLYDPAQELNNTFQYRDDVKIYLNGNLVLRGRIENVEKRQFNIVISGRDYTARFLDRLLINESYTNREISDIIKNSTDGLIKKYTPDITTNNVQTTNKNVTISWKGVPLLKALHELAEIVNYDFYVDDNKDLNFFPRASKDSGLTLSSTTNILTYSAPDIGKNVVTRLTFYGKEGICVQVEDLQAQQQWGVIDKTIVDPAIEDETTAYDKAKSILKRLANPMQRVTAVCLISDITGLKPGQIVTINIPERDINGQYIVLELTYKAPPWTAEIKTVAYSLELQDILADITKKVLDIDMRDADLEATPTRYFGVEDTQKQRVIVKIYRTFVNAGYIFGHDIYSKFGTAKFGYSAGSEELIWSNET
ncbi:MAG: hypothetical protein DRP01_06535 [Archaeoglobales archaeon]|nr:MAG: hypothetical protein DRP01_06535 [Archaeoglobales archaeon]